MIRLRVGYAGTVTGPALSTFFFQGSDQASADDAANAVNTFMSSIAQVMAAGTGWGLESEVARLDTITGQLIETFTVTSFAGVGSMPGERLSPASQGLMRVSTGSVSGGRRVRGRLFIPSPTTSSNGNGAPLAAYRTAVNNAGGVLAADSAQYGVWSRVGGIFAPATGVDCWGKWAVLRSRRD